MRIIDRKFRPHIGRYILQCLLATVATMAILALMDAVEHTALIAALGASAFIAFTMPGTHVSEPRYLVGGYIVGIAVGVAFGLTFRWLALPEAGMSRKLAQVILGGLAVGLSIFVMVVINTEHPPAAGVALGLVVHETWSPVTIVVILVAIAALCLAKRLLRRFLIDLL